MAKANAWTRDTLTALGLENAHLEDWGEFGMGWQQINTTVRMVSPDPEPLWAQAAPWSSATKGPVSGEAVLVEVANEADLQKYKGKPAMDRAASGSGRLHYQQSQHRRHGPPLLR